MQLRHAACLPQWQAPSTTSPRQLRRVVIDAHQFIGRDVGHEQTDRLPGDVDSEIDRANTSMTGGGEACELPRFGQSAKIPDALRISMESLTPNPDNVFPFGGCS